MNLFTALARVPLCGALLIRLIKIDADSFAVVAWRVFGGMPILLNLPYQGLIN